jgi:tetratricopeptide (TPR) repeat protein
MIADGRLERLERLPIAIHNQEALQTAEVGWALIRRAEDARTGDPAVVLALSLAAEAVADHLSDAAAHELRLRAQAEQANAYRIRGTLGPARKALAGVFQARELEALPATTLGEIYNLHGHLLYDAMETEEACAAFLRALHLRRRTPGADADRVDLAGALIQAKRFREAQRHLTPALRRLQEEAPRRPRVLGAGYATAVRLFVEWAGAQTGPTRRRAMLDHAEHALRVARDYLRDHRFDRWAVILEWIVGRGNLKAGSPDVAVPVLDACVDAFLELGDTASAAAAAVDLGEAHLARGELAPVRDLATACLPIFRAADLPGDILRTFELLREAEEVRVARQILRRAAKRRLHLR